MNSEPSARVVISEIGSDITQKWRDIRTRYGYEVVELNRYAVDTAALF